MISNLLANTSNCRSSFSPLMMATSEAEAEAYQYPSKRRLSTSYSACVLSLFLLSLSAVITNCPATEALELKYPSLESETPRMLLQSSGLGTRTGMGMPSAIATSTVSSRLQITLDPKKEIMLSNRKNRGVLGFSMDANRQLLSSLYAHRPTNVDSSAWNLPNQWDVHGNAHVQEETASSSSVRSKSSLLSRGSRNNVFHFPASMDTSTLGGRPVNARDTLANRRRSSVYRWVPTRAQIEDMTVAELKNVCRERGLTVTGRKLDLQERLYEWIKTQTPSNINQQQPSSLGLMQAYGVDSQVDSKSSTVDAPTPQQHQQQQISPKEAIPNSLAEWSRTVDLEPLLNRREAIHKEILQGKPVVRSRQKQQADSTMSTKEFLSVLDKMFDEPSSLYSNREVKLMYQAAKHADQIGDRVLTRRILLELKQATPNDARVFRRLARLEKEDGNIQAARDILKEGLDGLHADNAFLWHGLGQMAASDQDAKTCYQKAIDADPSLPHPYHALGTLEHSQGQIARAMKTLKKGIQYCPKNHRLHHAMGDLYRDAKMLPMAESSYRKALKYGPPVSHGFAYTALAYTAYDQGNVKECRSWLRKAVTLNKGRQASAWVALAQLEESEGNTDAARTLCLAGLAQYERGLLQRTRRPNSKAEERSIVEDPEALKNAFLKTVPRYRSGDRFFNLYRTWARLEERYGSVESVDDVYARAVVAFPHKWKLAVDWAEYYAALNMRKRARELFARACAHVSSRHAEPYRLYAQFEMGLGNYTGAREILYNGAVALSDAAAEEGQGNQVGLAELFHTWGLCEWHLGEDLRRAEGLFDFALRLTESVPEGSKLRAYILYSLARLEYFREEYILAQHCAALCLKENNMPRGNAMVWDLWALIAMERGNPAMVRECERMSIQCQQDACDKDNSSNLSRMLGIKRPGSSASGVSLVKEPEMTHLMRRDPWHQKIFGTGTRPSNFYFAVPFPGYIGSTSKAVTDEVEVRGTGQASSLV